MAEYTINCDADSKDALTARIEGESVEILAQRSGLRRMEVYSAPGDARTFARGILALADELDGGEVAEATPKREIQVGDTVRILADGAQGAGVRAGETYTVREVTDERDDRAFNGPIKVDGEGANGQWHLSRRSVELVDEPAPEPALADWERDLLEGPARSSRAKYVEEARRLMEGMGADADHIIAVAQFLAADE